MTTLEFKGAVGKVYFDGGLTEDGKMIRKAKTYRNVAQQATADGLYAALQSLALLSERPFLQAEKVETAELVN